MLSTRRLLLVGWAIGIASALPALHADFGSPRFDITASSTRQCNPQRFAECDITEPGCGEGLSLSQGVMHLRGGKGKDPTIKQSPTLFSMKTAKTERYQKSFIPVKLGMLDLGPVALFRFLVSSFLEQVMSVMPVCVFLAGFQTFVLGERIEGAATITGGLFLVMIGLTLFNFGLLYGLMPVGKTLGLRLPRALSMTPLLAVAGLLGVAVTLAEPALSVVKTAGSLIQEEQAPYLYTLLHKRQELLVLAVAAGVGISASFGMLRIVKNWSIKPVAIILSFMTLALSSYVNWFTDRGDLLGLAWDLGAVTTGPVTVPLVIALGVGIASVTGTEPSPLTGFGVVTLASLVPVNCVLLLGLLLPKVVPGVNKGQKAAEAALLWYDQTPMLEVVGGIRALVPLVLIMNFLLRFVLSDTGVVAATLKVDNLEVTAPATLALVCAQVGIILFNIGLSEGLAKLGTVVGSVMPAAFTAMKSVQHAPIWDGKVGLGVALAFSWLLGFGATLAEPALSTLAITVEKLSEGKLKKGLIVGSVGMGVGTGIALGVLKIVLGLPLMPMLITGYAVCALLTLPSPEVLANVAWDSAGVTTGPITVPLVISLGLGLGSALGISDGFGILSLASVCPIISVLLAGLIAGRE